ncbi:MAG: VOC family protein [Pseudomonadota bacterium]
MFSHIMLGANDVEASRAFYDATFNALGYPPGEPDSLGRYYYRTGSGVFIVSRPRDGKEAYNGNGSTIGFLASSPEAIDAWHAAGLAHGGQSCEDPPGLRGGEHGKRYLAYLRDPAGNKICALHRMG